MSGVDDFWGEQPEDGTPPAPPAPPVADSGPSATRPPRGPGSPGWAARPVAVVGLVLVAWILVAGWALAWAALDLYAGRNAINAARSKSSAAELVEGSPASDLRKAHRRLRAAGRWLRSPALAPVRVVPVIGRQVRSLAAVSGAAASVADAGATGVTQARGIVRKAATGEGAQVAAGELAEVAGRTLDRVDSLDLGPERGLIGPIARTRADVSEKLATLRSGLRRGAAGGRALATFLRGPRRYLVLAANNSEMRAGSGMFLQVGELETEDGKMRLVKVSSVTDYVVPPGTVPLEGDLLDRWGWLHPNEDWRQLMLSPRFDAQAPMAAQMWVASGEAPVDGVLVLDPVALSGLLEATGPVEVDGRKVDADTVVQELLHDQYLRYTADETSRRREGLGELARAVFDALERGDWSVVDLARGMAPVASGRHVLAWSSRPEEQANWAEAGVDGALRPDSLLVGLSSRTGNKLDYFQHFTGEVSVAGTASTSDVTVRLTMHNRVPPGEPPYVAGDLSGTGAGDAYLGILSVSVPGAARNVRIEGVEELAVAGPDGPTQVVGFRLLVRPGERRTLVVRFQLPGSAGTLRVEPSARVPTIRWTAGEQTWTDTSPHLLTWGGTE